MDVPESSNEVTHESNCQVPLLGDTKLDSSNQDYNENESLSTDESSKTLFNIPLETQGEYVSQLIINGEVVNDSQANVSGDTTIEALSEVHNDSSELEAISLQDGSIEQVIVTTLSEIISCENDSMTTTACAMQSSKDLHLVESCDDIKTEAEVDISLKEEDSSLNSTNAMLDESLPSFIGEIDESVSLPPAEPLILDQDNIPHQNIVSTDEMDVSETEIASKNITDKTVLKNVAEDETSSENVSANEIVTENVAANEIATEKILEKEGIAENITENKTQTLSENLSSNVIVTENITVNEIDLTETPQTEIITTGESNIQYTVLPPGENSVYQEDGTLVVEYPLDTTAIGESQTTSLSEFIGTHKINITESSISNDPHVVEIVGNLVKREGNIIEMVEAPSEDESISAEVEVASDKGETVENTACEKQADSSKPPPKRRGRKATEGIPPHIVGHPIDKPTPDVINGKGLKPRLGVKIPYRKLASQIVSTSELQNHIIERARLKEEARSESEKKNLFTQKLTHRLAQSLLPKKDTASKTSDKTDSKESTEGDIQLIENILSVIPSTASENPIEEQATNPIEIVEQIVNEETSVSENVSGKESETEVAMPTSDSIEKAEIIFAECVKNSTNIESNSDLIAILEGDGEENSPIMNVPNIVEIVDTSENSSEIKAIEKEISLTEQKSSQPSTPQVREKKFFKSRESRIPDVSKEKAKESASKVKTSSINMTPKARVLAGKNEDPLKNNIFDIESTSVLKTLPKSGESKKNSVQDQGKGKSSGTVVEVEPQLKPAMVLKTYTRKRKSNDVATPEPPKKALVVSTPSTQAEAKIDCVTPAPSNVYVTKSSRVIKRKVIWDPDEAMPSVRSQSKILSKIETSAKTTPTIKTAAIQKQTPLKIAEKKMPEKEKQPEPSKAVAKTVDKKITKNTQDEKERKIIVEKPTVKKPEKLEGVKKTAVKPPEPEKITPQTKVVITSSLKISPARTPKKSTKRLTEIDKLLMDEGAVNMLYDINNSDDQKRRVSGRTSSTPTDKAQSQKELLDRTLEVKNELTQGTSTVSSTPKTLRKKEVVPSVKKDKEMKEPQTTASRKMSKDSTKSSTHSPPPSPAAFTPAEASRIIRRHSSSSFSSNDGLAQDQSVDTTEKEKEKPSKKREVPVEQPSETVDDVNTQEEQNKGKVAKKRAPFPPEAQPRKKMKRDEAVVANGEPSKPTEIVIKSEPGIITGALKTDPTKAFTVIKMNKHYMINLTYFGGENYLSVQLLRDLVVTLRELERTRNCSVVSINSQGPAFCLGIDYKELVESDEELRHKKILEMSNAVRDLLKCLLNFSKIIVAGVKGDCVGLGVTMLPLFDMIVATDTASFSTPYAKVGCPPEAGFLLSIPYQSNHGLASELLYTAQRMNADEAQRRGLVTKLFWPEKFDSEFRGLLTHISNLSKPALMVTKRQLRQAHQKTAETGITSNCKLLMKYWGVEECQKGFLNYNALTFDIDH
ncbi:E3 ubiquitin-protein ligase RBBP6 [Coccinella septempunctata]|uniref:E3 ubiquitin-protein ligase RBBP6 n=1 Tax=Coccinella septempunctata TaxID=41139 RepID=UPI001D086F31|nr:E3 ubiquitin-protein ligase RBBP6 [Coccinella septempunctata]